MKKQKVSASGLKFEILREGRGEKTSKGQRFTVEFSMFNERGQLVATSLAPETGRIVGRHGGGFRGPAFLPEAIGMMRVGESMRFEVPPALCYGKEGNGHLVPPDSLTFWELSLLKLAAAPKPRAVPEFRRLARHEAKHNSCVSSILPVHDELELVGDLQRIRTLIECGVPLTPERRLVTGDRVRVKHGLLQGIEGIIIRRENGNRLLVAVNYLQQGVSIQIDDVMVEPI